MVSELIDEATSEWKAALIKQIFLPTKAQTILSIPQSHRRTNDRMVWAYTPKGNFMVNSAYKVAITISPIPPQRVPRPMIRWDDFGEKFGALISLTN